MPFLFFDYNDDFDWILLVGIILINAIIFAVTFLSRGFAFYYNEAKINSNLKNVLKFIQIGASLVLALALPNNYLNEFSIINNYYTKSGLWIFASSVLLFLIFVLIFGIIFSLLARLYTKETIEKEEV